MNRLQRTRTGLLAFGFTLCAATAAQAQLSTSTCNSAKQNPPACNAVHGDRADGWISHYFGHTVEAHRKGAEPGGQLVAAFLEYWRDKGKTIAGTPPQAN